MNTDPMTLIITAAGAVAVACVVFNVTTLQRHHDRPNRLAAGSLLATCVGLVAGPTAASFDDAGFGVTETTAARIALMVTACALSLGAGLLWSAARAFAGREPTLTIVGVSSAAVGAASVVAGASERWALVPVGVAIATALVLAVSELRKSPMASNLNSLILEVCSLMVAAAILVGGLLTGMGRISLSTGWAALASAVATISVVAAMTLMALRVERYGNWWTLGEDLDRSELGVDERDTFLAQAHDRIERCRVAGQPVHVITTALPGLTELNLAYGHLAGDAAMRWVAELLRRQAPPSAVLGHLGAGRFAIVTSREPELVANSIQNGMIRVPPPATLPVRLTPVFAWSASDEVGFDFDLLRYTAEERLGHVA